MPVGYVKFYRDPQGVGAISSDALPVGRDAWVHFSVIEGDGYRTLTVGESVDFEFEQVKQDSFDYRATMVRRRHDRGVRQPGSVADVTRPLDDLPPYIYGTTRLGDADVARDQQLAMARAVLDAGLWMHTSRQYHHALEVLGEAFAEDPSRVPPLIVKLGGGTAADIRDTITANLTPLGIGSVALGQLNPVGELAEALVSGGPLLDDLRRIRDEGLVGRFLLEIFPWTSAAPLAALRAGHLDGLVDGFITYYNPLQRFAATELWDELVARDASIISMRTVCGAPVQMLRDVPGAAWKSYLQQRAVEVAPVFERSGISSWAEFCFRFVRSTPQVVATVGATSRQQHLDELMAQSRGDDTLPADILDELGALQQRWSAEVDVHAEPWTM